MFAWQRMGDAAERPTSADSRRAWEGAQKGQIGPGAYAEADDDEPAAMQSEQYLDGKVVVQQGVEVEEEVEVEEPPHGCWYKFKAGLRSVWATRHTEDTKEDRELYIKTTLRELIIYVIFLIVLMIVAYGMTSLTTYYYTKVMSDLFMKTKFADNRATFDTSTTIDDFWKFARDPLPAGIYWDTWYNQMNVSDKERNFIYYENKLLGVPRMRQVRVRNDSCNVPTDFQKDIRECFGMFSPLTEEKNPYGLKNGTAWNYTPPEVTGASDFDGQISRYTGGGYYANLGRKRAETDALIKELWTHLWIDRGTRAITIDFTVYNANINLFCVVKLLFELPATGGAITSGEFRTVKLIRYVDPHDYFVLACECIFILFIVYYIVEEVIEIKKHRWSYFSGFWNWLDILVIVISVVCAIFNIYRTVEVQKKLQGLLSNGLEFPEFDFLSYWQQRFNEAIAITVFIAWVKIFKYISFNKTMTQLSSTLGRCAKDLAGFAVMFFIIFFAFAQLGYLIFGTQVKDFREFQHAVFTLFRIILGDFDFQQLEKAHRVLGPIFFILYVFFVFFVLINMFLAIINDTYSEVKSELALQKNEFEMTDYFKSRANVMLEKLNLKHDKIADIQKAIQAADINNDRNLDFDEWRNELKTRGYADGEIEAVFANYDLDGDRILDESEQKRMQMELEGQKAELSEKIEQEEKQTKTPRGRGRHHGRASPNLHTQEGLDMEETEVGGRFSGVAPEEMMVLTRRVDRMEQSIGTIVNKIDSVLVKMESMELAKVKRREMMGKILDTITQSDSADDEQKKADMERLVREELAQWDAESSGSKGTRSRPSSGIGGRGFDTGRD